MINMGNRKRTLRRKETNLKNASKGGKQPTQLSPAESMLFTQNIDLQQTIAKDLMSIKSDIAKIERETNNIVQTRFIPMENSIQKINDRLDLIVDKLLDLDIEFSDDDIAIFELVEEETKTKEINGKEVVKKKVEAK